MTIELFKNNGIPYLRLVESRGIERRGAKVVQRRKTVLSIGPLSRHDDGRPDYLLRLRQSFRDGKPLIKSLEPFVGAVPRKEVLIPFREGDEKCLGEPKRMAAAILDPVFAALGLDELFASVKFASRIKYDLTGIVRLLVYGRLLDPASKRSTMGQSGGWHRPLVGESYQGCVYDALDVICANSAQIIRRMDTCVRRGAGRDAKVVFYDVTNFYFEIPWPDGDVLDAKGNVVAKGLRKLGVSKENRRQPIVQLGLFMDDNGIPISFGMFPGNTLDHHTLKPAMKDTVDTLAMGRYILVADRGMYSGPNVLHAVDAGNGYIVAKSLRKSTKADVAWAADPKGYDRPGADFRCKSKVVTRTVKVVTKDKDGKDVVTERRLKEKIVVYWSRAFYERERHEHESFLSFVEKLKANPAGFRVTAAQPKDLRKFLKKENKKKKTGEVLAVPRDEGNSRDPSRLRADKRPRPRAPHGVLHRPHDAAAHTAQDEGLARRGARRRPRLDVRHSRRAARQGARGLAGGRTPEGIPADAERHRRRHQDGAEGVRHRDPAPALHERRHP